MDEEQFAQLIAQAAALGPDEAIPFLEKQGLSLEDMEDALDTLEQLTAADDAALDTIAEKEPEDADERIISDAENELEESAQKMADEDDTSVNVTESDKDSDGDMDKVTAEKSKPNDDTVKDKSSEVNDEKGDDPHDQDNAKEDAGNRTNSIAKHLSGLRGPGME